MAAKETDRSVTAIPRIYKGVRYASFLEMSRVFGIPVRTVISRWYRHRSMEMPVQQRAESRPVTVDGITYPSIMARPVPWRLRRASHQHVGRRAGGLAWR